jgi:hypothetical protein
MSNFDMVFATLRQLMLDAAPHLPPAKDEPGDFVVYSTRNDSKTGKPVWFGAVATKKSYVAYHLFPLYEKPGLGEGMSSDLARRRQGKSCFNFNSIDEILFSALAALTRRSSV